MRVLHLTETNIDWDYRIAKQVNAISNNFDLDVSVCCSNKDNIGAKTTNLNGRVTVHYLSNRTIKKLPIPRFAYHLCWFTIFNVFIYRKLKHIKPDIVHCHDVAPMLGVRLFGLSHDFKLLYDAHEINHFKIGSRFVNRYGRILETIIWKRVDILVSVSDSILEYYSHVFGPKKSFMISNQNEYSLQPGYTSQKYSAKSGKKEYVFVGAFVQGRNIELILETFAKISNSNVSFIGYGVKSDIIKMFADKYENIRYVGSVAPSLLLEELSRYDCGLNLLEAASYSDYLSVPNKFHEYFKAGIPQVVSDFPELGKMVTIHSCGYIYDNSIDLVSFLRNLDVSKVFEFGLIRSFKDEVCEVYNWILDL